MFELKLEGAVRIDDTHVHKAIREALANCIVNTASIRTSVRETGFGRSRTALSAINTGRGCHRYGTLQNSVPHLPGSRQAGF